MRDAADLHQQGQSRSWLQVRVRNSCTVTLSGAARALLTGKTMVLLGLVA